MAFHVILQFGLIFLCILYLAHKFDNSNHLSGHRDRMHLRSKDSNPRHYNAMSRCLCIDILSLANGPIRTETCHD
jgi:hypothetical protein